MPVVATCGREARQRIRLGSVTVACRNFRAGIFLACLALATPAGAQGEKATGPRLRLVEIRNGLGPGKPEAQLVRYARGVGLDVTEPEHPLVIHGFRDGRLFYVFYKTVENAFGDRPYLIQKIRRTERTWRSADDEKPSVKVTYQVEVFKTVAGRLKRADRHYGRYSLRELHRREVVKEYEIGFGEVPGACEGSRWPFDSGKLFVCIQPFGTAVGLFEKVRFHAC
ncbi:MAG: hypothetical protein ACYSX0_09110 [Planctomycetota bacterium]